MVFERTEKRKELRPEEQRGPAFLRSAPCGLHSAARQTFGAQKSWPFGKSVEPLLISRSDFPLTALTAAFPRTTLSDSTSTYEVTLIFVVHGFANSARSSLLKTRFPLYYPLAILVSAGNRDILLAIGDQKGEGAKMVAPVQPERETTHA